MVFAIITLRLHSYLISFLLHRVNDKEKLLHTIYISLLNLSGTVKTIYLDREGK